MKQFLQIIGLIFFGDKYRFCPHNEVEIITAQPVTMVPHRGKCKECGKAVIYKSEWVSE